MKNNNKMFLLVLLITSFQILHADWDPEYCFLFEDSTTQVKELEKQKFRDLKDDVKKALVNTWCSEEKINLLMDLTLLMKPSVCVEIGAFTGSSILPVAATLKYLNRGKVFAIDAWSTDIVIKNLQNDDPAKAWWRTVNMNDVHTGFLDMISKWSLNDFCIFIRQPSRKAIKQIGSIDFLHFDGDYSEKGSCLDVDLYLPKVKSGVYILLSNLFIKINEKLPKMKSFRILSESCELICTIEQNNAVLLRKR